MVVNVSVSLDWPAKSRFGRVEGGLLDVERARPVSMYGWMSVDGANKMVAVPLYYQHCPG